MSACVLEQDRGLDPLGIFGDLQQEKGKRQRLETLEALTGSCLTLSSFPNHSPISSSLPQCLSPACLSTEHSAFQQKAHPWVMHLFGIRGGSLGSRSQPQELRGSALPDSSAGPNESRTQRCLAEEPSSSSCAQKSRPC